MDLVVLIASKGRPESVERMAAAFAATGAGGVPIVWAVDDSDLASPAYHLGTAGLVHPMVVLGVEGGSMAAALNEGARWIVNESGMDPFAVAVLNDDHLPRTEGWHLALVDNLAEMGAGIVYPNDLLRGERLPTAWAMTADVVRAINRVVPALVEHLYADNAVLDLGQAAGCIRYLPDVVVEHMHPTAGKAAEDAGYRSANSRAQKTRDRAAFERWRGGRRRLAQIRAVREVVEAATAERRFAELTGLVEAEPVEPARVAVDPDVPPIFRDLTGEYPLVVP
jgi:hypothetical protein